MPSMMMNHFLVMAFVCGTDALSRCSRAKKPIGMNAKPKKPLFFFGFEHPWQCYSDGFDPSKQQRPELHRYYNGSEPVWGGDDDFNDTLTEGGVTFSNAATHDRTGGCSSTFDDEWGSSTLDEEWGRFNNAATHVASYNAATHHTGDIHYAHEYADITPNTEEAIVAARLAVSFGDIKTVKRLVTTGDSSTQRSDVGNVAVRFMKAAKRLVTRDDSSSKRSGVGNQEQAPPSSVLGLIEMAASLKETEILNYLLDMPDVNLHRYPFEQIAKNTTYSKVRHTRHKIQDDGGWFYSNKKSELTL